MKRFSGFATAAACCWLAAALGTAAPSAKGTCLNQPPATKVPMDAETKGILEAATAYALSGPRADFTDSSDFVRRVFAARRVTLPRRVREQARTGAAVTWEDLRAGDRLYFRDDQTGRLKFTGIYLGNGRFVYASARRQRAVIENLAKPAFYNALVEARRL